MGNGFGWRTTDPERERDAIAHSITTKPDRYNANFIVEHPKSDGLGDTGQVILAGDLNRDEYLDIMNRVYSPDGIAPTIHSRTGGGMIPKIEVENHE